MTNALTDILARRIIAGNVTVSILEHSNYCTLEHWNEVATNARLYKLSDEEDGQKWETEMIIIIILLYSM